MLFLRKPSRDAITDFLGRQAERPFSYPEVGQSRHTRPSGYVVDHRRMRLGDGQEAFDASCAALRQWQMFNTNWVQLCWPTTRIAPGSVVAVLAHGWGFWWLNACRIIYVIDESEPVRRFGFAYGTLADHAECGEERFTIEWDTDDAVWYDLFAFSRPGHWLVQLGYPLARRMQIRFAHDSLAAMAQAAGGSGVF